MTASVAITLADYCLHCCVSRAGGVVLVGQHEASEERAQEHGQII